MELSVWSKIEDKSGNILALRDGAVHLIKVSGGKTRKEASRILEALSQGQEPANVGANSVQTLDVASIGRLQVSDDGDDVELHAEGENGTKLEYAGSDKKGDEIARAIIARSGRTFHEEKQDITAGEAVLPPIIIGVILGFFWGLLYLGAKGIEQGEEGEVHGRHALLKQLVMWVAELLGTNGTLALGAVLLGLMVWWAVTRLVRRPQRTVWQLERA